MTTPTPGRVPTGIDWMDDRGISPEQLDAVIAECEIEMDRFDRDLFKTPNGKFIEYLDLCYIVPEIVRFAFSRRSSDTSEKSGTGIDWMNQPEIREFFERGIRIGFNDRTGFSANDGEAKAILEAAAQIALSRRSSGDEDVRVIKDESASTDRVPVYRTEASSGDEGRAVLDWDTANGMFPMDSPAPVDMGWLDELENTLSDASRPATDYNSRARVLTFNEVRVILRRALASRQSCGVNPIQAERRIAVEQVKEAMYGVKQFAVQSGKPKPYQQAFVSGGEYAISQMLDLLSTAPTGEREVKP